MKELVGPFNQEKALVGAFSVIVKTDAALVDVTRSAAAAQANQWLGTA